MKRIALIVACGLGVWLLACGAQFLWTAIDLAGWNFWKVIITK